MLKTIPDKYVQMCVTSPPYWGLRDYGVEGQIGLEATLEEWIENLVAVFSEVRRILRDDGTLWLNIGDAYGSGTAGPRKPSATGKHGYWANPAISLRNAAQAKQLLGLPWRLAFALQADGWYLRADIIWHKPNPMPESVTDRPTKAHEYIFLLAKSERYFYDLEAIREPTRSLDPDNISYRPNSAAISRSGRKEFHAKHEMSARVYNPAGRNRRSVWEIATAPYRDAHFATFPTKLIEPCIKAGTSERGCCPECGAPWQRLVEKPNFSEQPKRASAKLEGQMRSKGAGYMTSAGQAWQDWRDANPNKTLGWERTCEHDAQPVPCIVLDPFLGSGTTAFVAKELGRLALGIELNPDYLALARKRCQQATVWEAV